MKIGIVTVVLIPTWLLLSTHTFLLASQKESSPTQQTQVLVERLAKQLHESEETDSQNPEDIEDLTQDSPPSTPSNNARVYTEDERRAVQKKISSVAEKTSPYYPGRKLLALQRQKLELLRQQALHDEHADQPPLVCSSLAVDSLVVASPTHIAPQSNMQKNKS